MSSSSVVDHLVYYVDGPPNDAIARFTKLGFQIHFGGQHSDAITSNSLIVLSDGVYLEIVSIDASAPGALKHPWSRKSPGWIDWDITPPVGSHEFVNTINKSHGTSLYQDPIKGGRLTAGSDPVKLEWLMTFPSADRGKLPVLCEDVSKRELRVRMNTSQHPNGATGLSSMTVLAKQGGLTVYQAELESIFGPGQSQSAVSVAFPLATFQGSSPCQLVVREAQTDKEISFVDAQGEGLYSIELWTEGERKAFDDVAIQLINV